jgi:hypothetical protein
MGIGFTTMPNNATERVDLLRTNMEITVGEARVVTQTLVVQRLLAVGRDAAEAEAALKTRRDALDGWREYRQELLRALDEPE